ncbi:MAG: hypothetical protein IPG50_21080 [Myxococcales bacterium]|nr:hypothetical protein [Myxococcales bacterium]
MKIPSNERLIRAAAVLAIVALPLMVWSVFNPTVWPILLALSLGQGLGTLSFLMFLVVVVREALFARAERRSLRP